MSSSSPAASAASTVTECIYDVNDNDVLLGRGAGPNDFPGNVSYRGIIKRWSKEYMNATVRGTKTRIARKIVATVRSQGGRFLRKVGEDRGDVHNSSSSSSCNNEATATVKSRYVEMTNDHFLVQKTKQAIRHMNRLVVVASGSSNKHSNTNSNTNSNTSNVVPIKEIVLEQRAEPTFSPFSSLSTSASACTTSPLSATGDKRSPFSHGRAATGSAGTTSTSTTLPSRSASTSTSSTNMDMGRIIRRCIPAPPLFGMNSSIPSSAASSSLPSTPAATATTTANDHSLLQMLAGRRQRSQFLSAMASVSASLPPTATAAPRQQSNNACSIPSFLGGSLQLQASLVQQSQQQQQQQHRQQQERERQRQHSMHLLSRAIHVSHLPPQSMSSFLSSPSEAELLSSMSLSRAAERLSQPTPAQMISRQRDRLLLELMAVDRVIQENSLY